MFVVCFISQWMKGSKHGLFVYPPKKTLISRRHCSIGQLCCSITSKRSVDWFLESSSGMKFFSAERSLNQPKATRICIRSIDQSNHSISVRLLFLFCSRVFISRSYENRFIRIKSFVQTANLTGHFVHMEPFNKFPLCSYELWTARQCISTTKVKRLPGFGSCHWDF